MVSASIISTLDHHSGSASVLVSVVLVAVTIYYAVQNRAMAQEVKRSREAADRPKLAPDFMRLGPTAIRSVGPGAAFDFDVTITWHPIAGEPSVQTWQRPVLAAGEQRDLMPAGGLNNSVNILPATFKSVRMAGTMRDAHAKEHKVDHAIADLAAWRKGLAEFHERFQQELPERRLAEAFDERLNKQVQRLERAMGLIQVEISQLRRPSPDTPEPAPASSPPQLSLLEQSPEPDSGENPDSANR